MTTPTDHMDKLREALKPGRRVEIDLHDSPPTASLKGSADDARGDAEANARGRVARIIDEDGQPAGEWGVTIQEARELIGLGAVEV